MSSENRATKFLRAGMRKKKHIQEERTKLNAELQAEYESLSSSIGNYEQAISEDSSALPDPDIRPLFSVQRALAARMSHAPRSLSDKLDKLGRTLRELEKLATTRMLRQKFETLEAMDKQIIELENNIISGTFSKSEDLDHPWQDLDDRFQSRLSEKEYSKLKDVFKQRLNSLLEHCTETKLRDITKAV